MFLYRLIIPLYAGGICLASLFNKKARLLVKGHMKIFKTLREKVDPDASYLWFHASSLGEFEQGRPLIERLLKKNTDCKILLTFFSPS